MGDGAVLSAPFGWLASLGVRITPKADAVIEVTGNYRRVRSTSIGTAHIYQFQAGARHTFAGNSRTRPFVQLVAGLAHGGTNRDLPYSFGHSWNAFVAAPAVGIDYRINGALSLRVQGDWGIYLGSGAASVFRLGAGVVFGSNAR